MDSGDLMESQDSQEMDEEENMNSQEIVQRPSTKKEFTTVFQNAFKLISPILEDIEKICRLNFQKKSLGRSNATIDNKIETLIQSFIQNNFRLLNKVPLMKIPGHLYHRINNSEYNYLFQNAECYLKCSKYFHDNECK